MDQWFLVETRDALSKEHLVGAEFGLLECKSVRSNPPGEQWSRREMVEVRGTKCNFDVQMDAGIPGPLLESRRDEGTATAATRERTFKVRCVFCVRN